MDEEESRNASGALRSRVVGKCYKRQDCILVHMVWGDIHCQHVREYDGNALSGHWSASDNST